jgi:hypothetical protein
MKDFRLFLRQIISGFAHGLGWRAARMMPVWVVLIILIVALVFGIDWNST